jgi:hypothetical protein
MNSFWGIEDVCAECFEFYEEEDRKLEQKKLEEEANKKKKRKRKRHKNHNASLQLEPSKFCNEGKYVIIKGILQHQNNYGGYW